MANHLFDGSAGGLEILTGIEVRGVLIEVFADGAGHCKAEIAVDINLADCHACRFAEHILGDTDLSGNPIDDSAVEVLCTLTGLEKLDLQRTGISQEGIAAIRAALPKANVLA